MVDKTTEVEELPSHKWMTLGQIKSLMKFDNYVNMDARTVVSCIPFVDYLDGMEKIANKTRDSALYNSIANGEQPHILQEIYSYINNYKMFAEVKRELVPLYSLENWTLQNNEFICKNNFPFKVVFCDISIEGREVRNWGQPLFEAVGMATFGLFTAVENGRREFLVRAKAEIGCLDIIELAPTVQLEASEEADDEISKLFLRKRENKQSILYDAILSEEGGRFYHEQNINCIIEIEKSELESLPEGYFWLTYYTLNKLTQINNILNIQLRNLLSMLEV
jgi:oxidase EvaA